MDLDGDSPWGDVPSRSENAPKADTAQPESQKTTPSSSQVLSSSTSRGGRASRVVKKYGTQPTRLEAVEDDPLGPLGSASEPQLDEPPIPPQKEQVARQQPPSTSTGTGSIRTMMDSVNLEDDDDATGRPKQPPPVQPPAPQNGQAAPRQTQPSMGVLEAARPTFNIVVGDPHKVGDLTSSHTEYNVTTKTTSKAYRNPTFTVSRRYKDFLWLYNTLHNNSPGIVVPPPPEKQAVGRFDADFVESRRQALERMLNKAAAHPILQNDGDLKLFLESESFEVDKKNKERKDPLGVAGEGGAKSMFSSIGIGAGSGGKFVEHDDWFHDRRVYLDALETQLKALDKAVVTVVAQRKALAESSAELSASLHSLAAVELSPSLSGPLDGLGDIHARIRDVHDRQAQQDVLTIGIVIDEYIRLIASVKKAFEQRQRSYHAWHAAEAELAKRRSAQDKLLRQGRSQQDRIAGAGAEVQEAERRVNAARLLFDDMGRVMRGELERFEREKVEDFKSGVETFLESAVEAQKELIEVWETYLMQLDADAGEDDAAAAAGAAFGMAGPPPPGAAGTPAAAVVAAAGAQGAAAKDMAAEDDRPGTASTEGTNEASAAATAAAAAAVAAEEEAAVAARE